MRSYFLRLVTLLVILTLLGGGVVLAENITLNVISHRFPALEFAVDQMGQAIEGVKVEGNLMPWPQQKDIAITNFSAGSDAYDIVYANTDLMCLYANSGWIIPLDEYIEKYEEEFNFNDIKPSVFKNLSWKDRVYIIPMVNNVIFLAYRADLFEAAGLEPPKTIDEMIKAAAALTTEDRYGIAMGLLPGTGFINDFNYYLNTVGGRWFDEEMKPVFNDEYGVKALEVIKELMQYAPPDTLTYYNDETTAALQQDRAAMALLWQSRALTMDDPNLSKVVGKIKFVPAPGLTSEKSGNAMVAHDGYGISAFTKHDPDLIFRVIAKATSEESIRKGAELILPARMSVLEDPELLEKHHSWPAALKALETARTQPIIPEWALLLETISRPLHRALTGELSSKEALDEAAAEVEKFLAGRGYY